MLWVNASVRHGPSVREAGALPRVAPGLDGKIKEIRGFFQPAEEKLTADCSLEAGEGFLWKAMSSFPLDRKQPRESVPAVQGAWRWGLARGPHNVQACSNMAEGQSLH